MRLILTSDTHFGHNGKTQGKHHKFLSRLKAEKPDVLVHAGDWTSHSQKQFHRTLQMFRESLDCPIVAVRGNHDFWQDKDDFHPILETEAVFSQHDLWFREFGIHHVSYGALEFDGWSICGFDGWYSSLNPPTNDEKWLPPYTNGVRTMEWFSRKAHRDLNDLLDKIDSDKTKKVCVTHFPSFSESPIYYPYCANQSYLEVLSERFELLLVGHSHRSCDWTFRGMRIVNSGSDYNDPKYTVLSLE